MEVKLAGKWGTVCDDDFDDYDAKVSFVGLRLGGENCYRQGFIVIILLLSLSSSISLLLFSFLLS